MNMSAVSGRRGADRGLLALRTGAAGSSVLLVVLGGRAEPPLFHFGHVGIGMAALLAVTGLVAIGFFARPAAVALTVFWAFVFWNGIRSGEPFYDLPSRDILFTIAFLAVAIAGAGRLSIDGLRSPSAPPRSHR